MTEEIITSPDAAVLNDLAEAIGSINDAKGFREPWKQRRNEDDAMNIVGTKLMLTVSELAEALEEMRDKGVDTHGNHGSFGEELADAVIRIFDLADMLRIPIGDEVIRKMLKNADRPHMHDRRF
jgi:NTP pyrophosphatase (non-canonical NTP hydrolase)